MGDLLYVAALFLAGSFLAFFAGAPRLPGEPFWLRAGAAVVAAVWAAIVVTDLFAWVHG